MLRGPLRFEMVDDEMAALMRAKTPAERVACVTAANHTARLLASAGIRHQHPEWDDEVRFQLLDDSTHKTLKVQVYDEDKREHDLIGETAIDLNKVINDGECDGE